MANVNESCPDGIGAGAPESEIEITPSMIEAGVEALAFWDRDDRDEWKVWYVYREMEKARVAGLCPRDGDLTE